MRFTTTAAAAFTLLSAALALPIAGQDGSKSQVFRAMSDTGAVDVDLAQFDAFIAKSLANSEKRATIADISAGVTIVNTIIDIGTKVDHAIENIIQSDLKRRQLYTQHVVSELRKDYPDRNFVMSNVGYKFDGEILAKQEVFFHNKIGRKVSFDVIAFKEGRFELRGDGGFENWAYIVDDECKKGWGTIEC